MLRWYDYSNGNNYSWNDYNHNNNGLPGQTVLYEAAGR